MASAPHLISCLAWVKRGVAKRHPDRVRLSEADIQHLMNPSENEDDSWEDVSDTDEQNNDGVERYNLDDYDNIDKNASAGLGMAAVACYASKSLDPYLSKDDVDVDSEYEEMEIIPDDNLLVLGKVCDDYFKIEVHVHNEAGDNLYCHRDLSLPSFPLSMEWMDFDPGEDQPGNFIAISSTEPNIDIWDLDVVDSLEPAFVLSGSKSKSKNKKKKSSAGHHDAVLDLSWNHLQRHVLASASADATVGLWDVSNGSMVSHLDQHTDKVQCLEWHPVENQMLLSGGFDHMLFVSDCRTLNSGRSWTLSGEVERVCWDRFNPFHLVASTDMGRVMLIDTRADAAVFTLSAHTAAVTGLALSCGIAGCLLTASADKSVKLWDISTAKPELVMERNLKMGMLQCAACCPDSPLLFAVGGERQFRILDLRKNSNVASHFGVGDASKKANNSDKEFSEKQMHELANELAKNPKKSKKKVKSSKNKHGHI